MGDVYLTSNLGYEGVSYEKRGMRVDACSEWSEVPHWVGKETP